MMGYIVGNFDAHVLMRTKAADVPEKYQSSAQLLGWHTGEGSSGLVLDLGEDEEIEREYRQLVEKDRAWVESDKYKRNVEMLNEETEEQNRLEQIEQARQALRQAQEQ